jgi:hypothetical protein
MNNGALVASRSNLLSGGFFLTLIPKSIEEIGTHTLLFGQLTE